MHELTGEQLINGQWTQPGSGKTFDAINPATGQKIPPVFGASGAADADAALRAAKSAFDQSQELDPKWPAAFLEKIADCIMDLGDALLERVEQESALQRPRVIGERGRTVNQMKMFAGIVREGSWVDATIDTADANRKPNPKPDLRRMLRPRGPIAVFGASNFPLAYGVCGGDTASAIAAGNSIVAKGHPSHPGTNELFAAAVLEAMKQSKLPLGLFNIVQGPANELGAALVSHPLTEAVGFTGSLRGGRALFDIAARRAKPIPVYAEMGSANPIVLLPGAMREKSESIAKGLTTSVLNGAGQFCTKPGIVLVNAEQSETLAKSLSQAFAGATEMTMLNRGLRDAFESRTSAMSATPGVTAVANTATTGNAGIAPGLFITDAADFLKHPTLHEEAFGPATLLVKYDSLDEALKCIDAIGGSLTASMHAGQSDDANTQRKVMDRLESIAGRVIVNGYPTGVEVNDAIVHGGPYPATTDPNSTSVGSAAIRRFVRMVAFQDTPDSLLPPALQNANPLNIWRTINGQRSKEKVEHG